MTYVSRTPLALALIALAVGACTARNEAQSLSGGTQYTSLDTILDGRHGHPAAAVAIRPATPVAVLPAWIGRPVRLQESATSDLFEQTVSLNRAPRGGARENFVLVRLSRTDAVARAGNESVIALERPTEAGIRAELAAAFPETAMQVVSRPAANAYGPYGFAIGRMAGGARCLYAWQWIEAAPDLDPASRRPGQLSLRIRLCRDDITLDAMAAAVDQIKLVVRFAGTALAAPPPRAATVAQQHARPRTAVKQPAAAVAETDAPATTALPSGRRYLGVPDATAPDDGRIVRNAGPGPATLSRGFVGAQPPAQTETIIADLPPEALRGPVARAGARP